MPKAATEIKHGSMTSSANAKEEVNVVVEYQTGDEIDKSLFSDDEWSNLVAAGAIEGEGPNANLEDAKAAQVAADEAQTSADKAANDALIAAADAQAKVNADAAAAAAVPADAPPTDVPVDTTAPADVTSTPDTLTDTTTVPADAPPVDGGGGP